MGNLIRRQKEKAQTFLGICLKLVIIEI